MVTLILDFHKVSDEQKRIITGYCLTKGFPFERIQSNKGESLFIEIDVKTEFKYIRKLARENRIAEKIVLTRNHGLVEDLVKTDSYDQYYHKNKVLKVTTLTQ